MMYPFWNFLLVTANLIYKVTISGTPLVVCCVLQCHVLRIYFSILNRQYKSVGGRVGLNSCPWCCLFISSTLDMNWASVCAVLYCPLVFECCMQNIILDIISVLNVLIV